MCNLLHLFAIFLLAIPDASATNECVAKLSEPSASRHALKFCHIFPDKGCCLPAQDAEIEEHYFNLLDAGDICAKDSSLAKDSLKRVFCAACSPLQPKYVRDVFDEKANTTKKSFFICQHLAEKVAPRNFDDCGMVRVEERGNVCAGDDVVVPSKQWADDANCNTPACTGYYKFINDESGAKPPFFPQDWSIEVEPCTNYPDDCNNCYTGGVSAPGLDWKVWVPTALLIFTWLK